MSEFRFEPIGVNSRAPGGARILATFDDVGVFLLLKVNAGRQIAPHWQAVRRDLVQARFGARQAEAYRALRVAFAEEGWLAE